MITREYRRAYEAAFRALLEAAPKGQYDECTLPSYAHRNPFVSWLFWKRIDAALALAGDLRNASVLDFGCGGGVLFRRLADNNCSITACENQFPELAEAMARRLNADVRVCKDVSALRGGTFDVIFALDVLEHVEELGPLVDAFRGLSHEGTRVVISGPTESLLYRLGRQLIGYAEQGRFHERTIYDIESTMHEKGLARAALKNIPFFIPLFRISSWSMPKTRTRGASAE